MRGGIGTRSKAGGTTALGGRDHSNEKSTFLKPWGESGDMESKTKTSFLISLKSFKPN